MSPLLVPGCSRVRECSDYNAHVWYRKYQLPFGSQLPSPSPSSTLNAVKHLLCIYHLSLSFHRPKTARTIRLTLGLPLAFCLDLFLNAEYRRSDFSQTSPRLLPVLSSLFWDEPIVPTNYFYTCYSLLVGFIPLGNHHSQARIFKPQYSTSVEESVTLHCRLDSQETMPFPKKIA